MLDRVSDGGSLSDIWQPTVTTSERPRETPLRAYLSIARERRGTLVFCCLLSLALALFLNTRPPVYQARTQLLVLPRDRTESALLGPNASPSADSGQSDVQTQVEILRSESVLRRACGQTGLPFEGAHHVPVTVEGNRDTRIITITTTDSDPSRASALANNIAAVYLANSLVSNRAAAHAGRRFLERQQKKLQGDLQTASRSMRDYEARYGAAGLTEMTANLVKALADAQAGRDAAADDEASALARARQIETALEKTIPQVMASESVSANPGVTKLQAQIADLEIQRSSLLTDYTPTSRRVRDIEAQIHTAQDCLKSLAPNVVSVRQTTPNPLHASLLHDLADAQQTAVSSRAKIAGLNRSIARYEGTLRRLPEKEYRLAQLRSNVQVCEKNYMSVQERYHQLRLSEESTLANAETIETASAPRYPVSPNKARNLVLALVGGLVLGAIVAVTQELVDTSVRGVQNIETVLGIPVLGTVLNLPSPPERSIRTAPVYSPIAEAFRVIRSQVIVLGSDNGVRSLMITSPGAQEGKGTIASNLAIALARIGKSVALVDADVRRPSLHRRFGLPNGYGLVDLVSGAYAESAALQSVEEHLDVVTTGPLPVQSDDVVESPKMVEVVTRLGTTHEYVILDGPPVLGLSDAITLSRAVDGVIVVLVNGKTDTESALRTIQLLQRAHAHVLGIVLNRANPSHTDYQRYASTMSSSPSGGALAKAVKRLRFGGNTPDA